MVRSKKMVFTFQWCFTIDAPPCIDFVGSAVLSLCVFRTLALANITYLYFVLGVHLYGLLMWLASRQFFFSLRFVHRRKSQVQTSTHMFSVFRKIARSVRWLRSCLCAVRNWFKRCSLSASWYNQSIVVFNNFLFYFLHCQTVPLAIISRLNLFGKNLNFLSSFGNVLFTTVLSPFVSTLNFCFLFFCRGRCRHTQTREIPSHTHKTRKETNDKSNIHFYFSFITSYALQSNVNNCEDWFFLNLFESKHGS